MKFLFLLPIALFSLVAQAEVYRISPGQFKQLGADLVVCGGGSVSTPKQFKCTCYEGTMAASSLSGRVVVRATNKMEAAKAAKHQCAIENRIDIARSIVIPDSCEVQ